MGNAQALRLHCITAEIAEQNNELGPCRHERVKWPNICKSPGVWKENGDFFLSSNVSDPTFCLQPLPMVQKCSNHVDRHYSPKSHLEIAQETCSEEVTSSYKSKGGYICREESKYIEPPCRTPSTPPSAIDAPCIMHQRNNAVCQQKTITGRPTSAS